MRARRWLGIFVGVVLVVFVAKHFLLDNAASAGAPYVIDLEALHRAATGTGPLPQGIEVEKLGDFAVPRTLVVAGDGFGMHPMVLLAHRVVWPDRSLIVDTGMSPSATQKMPRGNADPAAFERVEKAMLEATDVVFTHEHKDHVGGVAAASDPDALLKQVHMTVEQLNGKLERDQFPKGMVEKLTPLEYQGVYRVAPGVVLQKAPGHSPGSQLIYVELADGKRFLFVGDIAWSNDNIKLQIGRPGIITLLNKEDRPAVAAQVKALANLPADVHIVVAHDKVAFERDVRQGLYRLGFSAK